MTAAASYASIRRHHLIFSLRSLSRRQQAVVVLLAAFLGPFAIGFMDGLASGLARFVDPATSPGWRVAAWLAWFLTTGLVVLALREPVFMLAARPFVRMLPIARGAHLACDMRSIAIAYSFLWLPIGYFVWVTWASHTGLLAKVDAMFVAASALAIAMVLQTLSLQSRASAIALALLAAGAICIAPSLSWPASWLTLGGALGLAALALASGYERPARSRARTAVAAPIASRLAAWSGLAIPVAWRDLRHALGLRLAWVVAIVALDAWLANDGAFCGRRTGFHIVSNALLVLTMYRVPSMIDARLRESLPWLFRLGAARTRAIAWSSAAMLLAFGVATSVASATWTMHCGAVAQGTIAGTFGIALAVLAAAAFRWSEPSGWIAIVLVVALAFILGELS